MLNYQMNDGSFVYRNRIFSFKKRHMFLVSSPSVRLPAQIGWELRQIDRIQFCLYPSGIGNLATLSDPSHNQRPLT
jgi:hypothetical protein